MSNVVRLSLVEARPKSGGFIPRVRRDHAHEASPAPVKPMPDAYALGFEAGQQAATEQFAHELDAMRALLAATSALQPEPSEELAAMVALTVERLVTEITGRAPVEREWLETRAAAAAALVAQADAARTLWVNPEDVALLEGTDISLDIKPDVSLERGSLRIDCSAGWIEDGRSIHLDALRAELGVTS